LAGATWAIFLAEKIYDAVRSYREGAANGPG